MPNDPDSTTPRIEGEPLESDLPEWTTTRRRLDPLDPDLTQVLGTEEPGVSNPRLHQTTTHDEALDELRGLVDDLENEPPAPQERPTLSNRVRSILAPRSSGDPRVAAVVGGLLATVAGVASLGLDATVGKGSGAYVMHPEESAAIGEPLGRIAARRVSLGDADPTDIGDAIEAAGAAVMYGVRARADHQRVTTSTYVPDPQSPAPAPDAATPDPGAGNGLYFGEPPQ